MPLRSASARGTLAIALALHATAAFVPASDAAAGGAADARPPATSAMGAARTPEGDEVAALLASRRLIVPVAGIPRAGLRDNFNEWRGANRHEAIDIAAARGTPVLAAGDGRVVKLFYSVYGGHTVYQFDPDDRFAYYYAHLGGYAEGLTEGRAVRRGDVLGYVGTTGNAPADAPHLHFAIFRLGPERLWWRGTAVNPYPFLNDP